MSTSAPLWLACAGALLSGCFGEHRILEDGCELGDEVPIAELLGPAPHDVVLVGAEHPTHVAWSERAGLFLRELDGDATVVRLGAPCDAGMSSQGALLACARRGDDSKAQSGHVTVLDVETGAIVGQASGVGPDSFGVGLAFSDTERVLVWNDARQTTSSVMLRRGDHDAQRISREGVRAGRPAAALERHGGHTQIVLAWPETWLGDEGVEGTLRVQRGERLLELEPLGYDLAHPSIATDPEGEAVVVFRDRRPARTRPRMFVRRLDAEDHAHDGVPANADGEALAVACAGAMVIVAPRTHSRSERLVAVRRHDLATLEGSGPEHQIYMHGAAFEHADARCVGNDVLVAVASHATIERPHGAVSTVRFTCPDPSAATE
ncbi:MAG: hypothetical protein K1X94_16900 [Sandaracinaceae bacterium]|nr:hypothetical protein [Sandaracinaceae bacterium]